MGWAFGTFLAWSAASAAPLVTLVPGPRTIDPRGMAVNLSTGGTLDLPDGRTIQLTTIGGGLREKRVLFVTVSVYAAQFLVSMDDAPKLVRTAAGALDSIDEMRAVAMHLTFARNLSAEQLRDGLNDAMSANGYKVNEDPDLQALLRAIVMNGAIRAGTIGILAAVSIDRATDLVVYQSASGTISSVTGRRGLKRALTSAWLGKPADSGLRELRDEILGTLPER